MSDSTPQKGRRYLRAAGVSAWVLSGAPAVSMILGGIRVGPPMRLAPRDLFLWAGAWLIFILSFWLSSGGVGEERHQDRNRWLLLVETAAALFMFHLVCTGLETTLLAVVAAQLGVYFRLRAGLVWLFAQTVALFWLRAEHSGTYASWAWISCSLPFEALALFASYFAAPHQPFPQTHVHRVDACDLLDRHTHGVCADRSIHAKCYINLAKFGAPHTRLKERRERHYEQPPFHGHCSLVGNQKK
jgi:hypothetical protein